MKILRGKKQNKGITLIALVITIIVLLILAGVSIATLTGENGILTRANDAKRETTKAEARETIQLEMAASFDNTGKYNVEKAKENLEDNLKLVKDAENNGYTEDENDRLIIKYKGYEFDVDNKGRVTDHINIADYVKVGQYVDYEPTKTDVNKTQSVEASKLTYTSPTGGYDSTKGIITHGNGYTSTEEATDDKPAGGQTFTAKANDGSETGVKWRVLSVSDDKVELISDTVVKTDANANFILNGGIGYLYAEQELNEVCKIYGYGYGVDTSIETPYTVGGPEDTPITGKIKESGARSITIEDLNKIANIKEADYATLNSSYGSTSDPTTSVCYPTLTSSNTSYPGQSTSTKTGFKNTYYSWDKSKIEDTNIQSMLFNGNYWLSSRCIDAHPSGANFHVRFVHGEYTYANGLCYGYDTFMNPSSYSDYAVCPVVTLKSNVIDINTDYETEGEWKLK